MADIDALFKDEDKEKFIKEDLDESQFQFGDRIRNCFSI